jgi:hypothetical protein
MPETPDLDRIARELCIKLGFVGVGTPPKTIRTALIDVWNARGAADLAILEAAFPGAVTTTLKATLRSLDR